MIELLAAALAATGSACARTACARETGRDVSPALSYPGDARRFVGPFCSWRRRR